MLQETQALFIKEDKLRHNWNEEDLQRWKDALARLDVLTQEMAALTTAASSPETSKDTVTVADDHIEAHLKPEGLEELAALTALADAASNDNAAAFDTYTESLKPEGLEQEMAPLTASPDAASNDNAAVSDDPAEDLEPECLGQEIGASTAPANASAAEAGKDSVAVADESSIGEGKPEGLPQAVGALTAAADAPSIVAEYVEDGASEMAIEPDSKHEEVYQRAADKDHSREGGVADAASIVAVYVEDDASEMATKPDSKHEEVQQNAAGKVHCREGAVAELCPDEGQEEPGSNGTPAEEATQRHANGDAASTIEQTSLVLSVTCEDFKVPYCDLSSDSALYSIRGIISTLIR